LSGWADSDNARADIRPNLFVSGLICNVGAVDGPVSREEYEGIGPRETRRLNRRTGGHNGDLLAVARVHDLCRAIVAPTGDVISICAESVRTGTLLVRQYNGFRRTVASVNENDTVTPTNCDELSFVSHRNRPENSSPL